MNPSRKSLFMAGLALVVSFSQQPAAVGGVYEDLRSAAELNHTSDIAKLLAKGADPNTPDESGNTLLMIAVRNNNAELVNLLVNAGMTI